MVHIYQEKLKPFQFNGENMHEQKFSQKYVLVEKSKHLKEFWGRFVFISIYNQH